MHLYFIISIVAIVTLLYLIQFYDKMRTDNLTLSLMFISFTI